MNVELFKLWLVLIAVASGATVAERRTLYSSAAMLLLSASGAFEATNIISVSGGVTFSHNETTIAIVLAINSALALLFFIAALTGTDEEATAGAEGPAGEDSISDQIRDIRGQ